MENKIPTAEELSKRYGLSAKGALWTDTVRAFAIEFAKLHVEAALKAAYQNAELKTFYDPEEERPYQDVIESSILNAYPLTNIK